MPLRRSGRRGHQFEWGLLGLRRWLLYHTLIHEFGHWVDFLVKVEIPWQIEGTDSAAAYDAYWARPVTERVHPVTGTGCKGTVGTTDQARSGTMPKARGIG